MEFIDEEEHLNIGVPQLAERYEAKIETPEHGKWSGIAVLPRQARPLVETLVQQNSRTVSWMRTALNNLRYTDEVLEGLVRRAKAQDMKVRRAWTVYSEADEQLVHEAWAESHPREAGALRTKRFEAAGRVLYAVTELAHVWDLFLLEYEKVKEGEWR